MAQPVPALPTNVQSNNPYVGIDRGLFVDSTVMKVCRIHAARYVVNGPTSSIGVLQYQVMQYDAQPTTPAEYAAGTLVKAPDNTTWFDCLTRGSVLTPIVAEYWAINSYQSWYVGEQGVKLTSEEIEESKEAGLAFTLTMGQWAGLKEVEFTATFNVTTGNPLSRTSAVVGVDYVKGGVSKHLDITTFSSDFSDPVREALRAIKDAP